MDNNNYREPTTVVPKTEGFKEQFDQIKNIKKQIETLQRLIEKETIKYYYMDVEISYQDFFDKLFPNPNEFPVEKNENEYYVLLHESISNRPEFAIKKEENLYPIKIEDTKRILENIKKIKTLKNIEKVADVINFFPAVKETIIESKLHHNIALSLKIANVLKKMINLVNETIESRINRGEEIDKNKFTKESREIFSEIRKINIIEKKHKRISLSVDALLLDKQPISKGRQL